MQVHLKSKNILFVLTLLLLTAGCDKEETTTWKNALSFGTGTNGFNLTGEALTLPHGTLYFRLETQDDMSGSPVRIVVRNVVTQQEFVYNYEALQSYGHLYVGPMALPETGNFTAEGILTEPYTSIATVQLTIY